MERLDQLKIEVNMLQQNNVSDELYEDITKVKEKRVKEIAKIPQSN